MSSSDHPIKFRNSLITVFVIVWLFVFFYESSRHFILEPILKLDLPKIKLLFPPAGWIMFYRVDEGFGHADVYGFKGKTQIRIDPHDIFRTRTIGFDNIHRGILGSVANRHVAKSFCGFLKWRFPYFDRFAVVVNYYPNPTKKPYERYQEIRYHCGMNN